MVDYVIGIILNLICIQQFPVSILREEMLFLFLWSL